MKGEEGMESSSFDLERKVSIDLQHANTGLAISTLQLGCVTDMLKDSKR